MEQAVCLLFPFKSSITNTHFSFISFRERIYPQRVESNVQRKGCEFVLLELWRWLERKKIKLLAEPPKRGLWGRLFQAQFRMWWWWSLRLGLQKRYKSIQDSKFKHEKRTASKSNAFCFVFFKIKNQSEDYCYNAPVWILVANWQKSQIIQYNKRNSRQTNLGQHSKMP